jgi:hypothetical protein
MTIASVLFKLHFFESFMVASGPSILMAVVLGSAVVRILKW